MQPLIDADVLAYEIGFAAEAGWQSEGVPSFDYVAELLHMRIDNICGAVGATAPPILYMTGKHNFRTQIATRQEYKDRPSAKPWHYYNLRAYMKGNWDVRIQEGLEADDLMAIEQTRRIRNGEEESVICTRDKDLRAVPGWHYGWELGNQPQFGPELVDSLGWIKLSSDRKSIKGTGLRFFYAQCLLGDRVDSIKGVDGIGPVKAFSILDGADSEHILFERTLQEYISKYGEADGASYLLESGRLLWMTRELDEEGKPVLWRFPE